MKKVLCCLLAARACLSFLQGAYAQDDAVTVNAASPEPNRPGRGKAAPAASDAPGYSVALHFL